MEAAQEPTGPAAVKQSLSDLIPFTGPFTSVNCSAPVTVPFDYGNNGLPQDPNSARKGITEFRYANNIWHPRHLIANQYVRNLTFNFSYFKTEQIGDTLTFSNPFTTTDLLTLSGSPGLTHSINNMEMQGTGIRHTFRTDGDTVDRGYWLKSVTVSCAAPVSPAPEPITLEEMIPYDGLLIGAGDSVAFRIVQPAGHHLRLLLDAMPGAIPTGIEGTAVPVFDADIYLREGAMPEKDVFDLASREWQVEEGIRIPASNTQRVWFGVIHSPNSMDEYATQRFTLTHHLTSVDEEKTLKAGFRSPPTSGDIDRATRVLKLGMATFFGMTEGKFVVQDIKLYNEQTLFGDCDCDGPCDICFSSGSGRAYCNPLTNRAVLYKEEWGPGVTDGHVTTAHEWGHCVLGLLDEYNDHCEGDGGTHNDALCTRSIMSTYDFNARNLCTNRTHKKSSDPSSHICATKTTSQCGNANCFTASSHGPNNSAWHTLQSKSSWPYGGGHSIDTDPRPFDRYIPMLLGYHNTTFTVTRMF